MLRMAALYKCTGLRNSPEKKYWFCRHKLYLCLIFLKYSIVQAFVIVYTYVQNSWYLTEYSGTSLLSVTTIVHILEMSVSKKCMLNIAFCTHIALATKWQLNKPQNRSLGSLLVLLSDPNFYVVNGLELQTTSLIWAAWTTDVPQTSWIREVPLHACLEVQMCNRLMLINAHNRNKMYVQY